MTPLRFVLFSLAAVLLQGSVFPFLFPHGWSPDIWLCAVVISSMAFDRKLTLCFAVVGGVAQDVLLGNFFGLHLFAYTAVAFLMSAALQKRYNRRWGISLLAVIAGTACAFVLSWLVFYFEGGRIPVGLSALRDCGSLVVSNGFCAVFLHPLLWNLKREWKAKW